MEETAGASDFACDLKMRMASLNILEVGPGHRTAFIPGRFKFSCKGMLFHIKCDAGEQYFSEKPVITFFDEKLWTTSISLLVLTSDELLLPIFFPMFLPG